MFSRVDPHAPLLPEEELISQSFLSAVLGLSLVWAGAFLVGVLGRWLVVEPIHLANTVGFALVTLALLVTLRRHWMPHRRVAIAFFVALYLYIAAAQFLMPSDQFRILLFYPALGAVLFVLGYRAAFLALLISYAVFATAVGSGAMAVSPIAAATFLITLALTGQFFRIFHRQATHALRLVAQQNVVLDAAARLDPLTGLLNLRAFHEAMDAEMSDFGLLRSVAVLFVDVDHFKPINDRFGHAGGDAVLKALSGVLQGAVRQQDQVARIGGEEFAIFLPGANGETARQIAERVRAEAERMSVDVGGQPIGVTLSVGVAVSQPPHLTPDALVRAADLAMYAAKRRGRNRVEVSEYA